MIQSTILAIFALLLVYGPKFAYWQVAIVMYIAILVVILMTSYRLWASRLI